MEVITRSISETTPISDEGTYVVMAAYKDEPDAGRFEKVRGSWSECDDYAQRNDSPDNPERYEVEELLPFDAAGVEQPLTPRQLDRLATLLADMKPSEKRERYTLRGLPVSQAPHAPGTVSFADREGRRWYVEPDGTFDWRT